MVRWREAMAAALYGPEGFFVRPDTAPADHFRTSALASPLFAGAVLQLLRQVDEALGHPDPIDLVDVGAGRGELLAAVLAAAPPRLRERLRPVAVEVGDRLPAEVTGLLTATEWLDNVPVDIAEPDRDGTVRYVLVDPATGQESLGEPVTGYWLLQPIGLPVRRWLT